MVKRAAAAPAALLCFALHLCAQNVHTYIGQLGARSALIAWGTTAGAGDANTIGRDSASMGPARLRVADRTIETEKNWAEITDLRPDTEYSYEVDVKEKRIGGGVFRTWADRATRLVFFVLGDYGNGSEKQREVADAMTREFERRKNSGNPVRFVITVGDNIYANLNVAYLISHSGQQDADWEPKFFAPYQELLRAIPFLPTLGNHDGNASEARGDLAAYLDNFFFPGNKPARWYTFDYGGLVDFFALDTTDNTTGVHTAPAYAPDGDQSKWLAQALPASRAPWKIPYFHHPPFTAGPAHGASYGVLRHWVELFQKTGVKVVFTGHEHNFQMSEDSDATGHIRYIVSGAGGELRPGKVLANMARAHIEAWAPMRHFLVVEIDGSTMQITPIALGKVPIVDHTGKEIPMPIVITLK